MVGCLHWSSSYATVCLRVFFPLPELCIFLSFSFDFISLSDTSDSILQSTSEVTDNLDPRPYPNSPQSTELKTLTASYKVTGPTSSACILEKLAKRCSRRRRLAGVCGLCFEMCVEVCVEKKIEEGRKKKEERRKKKRKG